MINERTLEVMKMIYYCKKEQLRISKVEPNCRSTSDSIFLDSIESLGNKSTQALLSKEI